MRGGRSVLFDGKCVEPGGSTSEQREKSAFTGARSFPFWWEREYGPKLLSESDLFQLKDDTENHYPENSGG